MALRLLPLFVLLGGCNPIVGVTSFMHSFATGNTFGTITGGAGIVIEGQTGKSVGQHIWEGIRPVKKQVKDKKIQWVFSND